MTTLLMKTPFVLLLLPAFYLSIVTATPLGSSIISLSTCTMESRRGLGDLLGDDDSFGFQTSEKATRTTMKNPQTTSIPGDGLGSFLTDDPMKRMTTGSATATTIATTTSSYPYSVINSPFNPNAPSATSEVPTETISTGAQTPSSSDSKQWKIIGIAVIVVSIVVAVIFVVVFFDQWWSFLCDMVVGKRTGDWKENLVPDWEKRSWEFKRVSDQYPPAPPFPSELATKHQSIEDDRHPFPERPPNSNPFSPETVELGLAGCGTHRAKHDSGGHANEPAPGIHTAT